MIEKFIAKIQGSKNASDIVLLRNKEVLQWIVGDLTFLPTIQSKNKSRDTKARKVLEDIWGRKMAKVHRPDLQLDGQWTTTFGQQICHELYLLMEKNIWTPAKKSGFMPDKETDDLIIEVKTQTYNTTGTAGEKILGVPFKYCKVPKLYGKPLHIVCIGHAEKECREKYNMFGDNHDEEIQDFLDFYKTKNIQYIAATDLMHHILSQ